MGIRGMVEAMATVSGLIRGACVVLLISAGSICRTQAANACPHLQYTELLSFGPIISETALGDGSATCRMESGTSRWNMQKSDKTNAWNNINSEVFSIVLFWSPPNGPKIPPGSNPVPSLPSSSSLTTTRSCHCSPNPSSCFMLRANRSPSWSSQKEDMQS